LYTIAKVAEHPNALLVKIISISVLSLHTKFKSYQQLSLASVSVVILVQFVCLY